MADRADRSIHLALLAEAIENAPFAVSLFDEHGNYVAVNAKVCELTGYSREELIEIGPFGLAVRGEGVRAADVRGGARRQAHARHARGSGGRTRREVDITYRIGPTRVGGLPFLIRIYWETGS